MTTATTTTAATAIATTTATTATTTDTSLPLRVGEAMERNGKRIRFETYRDERQIARIKALMDADLSEPYSVFTYRYFINSWPHLCLLAIDESVEGHEDAVPLSIVGAVVCKCDHHQSVFRGVVMRGYIAMLAVDPRCRKLGIGSELVERVIKIMQDQHECHEVMLETELINHGALRLYESLGFVRDKRLHRYYLNGGDAFRLILRLV